MRIVRRLKLCRKTPDGARRESNNQLPVNTEDRRRVEIYYGSRIMGSFLNPFPKTYNVNPISAIHHGTS